ncbi:MAG: alginate lyase family protein [Deferribacteres bacterium]|nr:alginate lyase family protein [candidate division KSB1 bacterium]MCB9500620.1 alginate lyase family protein [Deferribacteres bacterium]
MSVILKAKKLVRMSPEEWRHRAKEYLDIQQERKNHKVELAASTNENFDFFAAGFEDIKRGFQKKDLSGFLKSDSAKRHFPIPLDRRKAMLFQLLYPGEFVRSIERADQFCAGKFAYMGIKCDFSGGIPWQSDPVSRQEYPSGFYRDIQIFHNRPGQDIKHVWEINRLQFLIEIAKAYYLTNDSKYSTKLEHYLFDWYEKNPFKSGVNWTSALEVGVRAFSLLWVLNFYLAAENPKADVVHLILKMLYLSGVFIKDNLSVYFSPYNHLIGEVAALFMLAYQLPILKNAHIWAEEAWQLLDEQIEKQFSADGGTVEQATFYHHFTLGFYLQCAHARRLNGDPVSQRILNQIERSIEFSMAMMRPDKTLPWIGDIDTARSVYFSNPANWNFTAFQSIGAVWFKRKDMKKAAGSTVEDAFWLLTQAEYERLEAVPETEPASTFYTLGSSGYTVMRSGFSPDSHFSYIDCGYIADGLFKDGTPSAAHGHADLLHIEVAPFGENLLIDPGFSNYRGDLAWHKYFRSTAAHNTLTIDGQSQLEQVGILSWSNEPAYFPLQRYTGEFCYAFAGEHHGFMRLPAKAVHRRYFLFIDQSFWLSYDVVHTSVEEARRRSHKIEAHFHTMDYAEIQLGRTDQHSLFIRGEKAGLQMFFSSRGNAQMLCSSERGGAGPEKGWISPTYRERRPAPVAKLAAETALPFELVALYLPVKLKEGSAFLVSREENAFTISISGTKYQIDFVESSKQNGHWEAKPGLCIKKFTQNLEQAIFLQSIVDGANTLDFDNAPIGKMANAPDFRKTL